jgi:hypothetical protein
MALDTLQSNEVDGTKHLKIKSYDNLNFGVLHSKLIGGSIG